MGNNSQLRDTASSNAESVVKPGTVTTELDRASLRKSVGDDLPGDSKNEDNEPPLLKNLSPFEQAIYNLNQRENTELGDLLEVSGQMTIEGTSGE
ncbi:MAG: hypothetical protein COA94_03020 [Rickettsiales bacterium]|nr:MAG: hypothetical protein COA94_03020 [Rickettsiales bacterium]